MNIYSLNFKFWLSIKIRAVLFIENSIFIFVNYKTGIYNETWNNFMKSKIYILNFRYQYFIFRILSKIYDIVKIIKLFI